MFAILSLTHDKIIYWQVYKKNYHYRANCETVIGYIGIQDESKFWIFESTWCKEALVQIQLIILSNVITWGPRVNSLI